jgi:putative hydroxymethylpyrimidine transport system substrate-binding protein
MTIRPLRSALAAATAAAALLTLSACGGDASSDGDTAAASGTKAVSAARCADNKAAGKITYMSGYYWQASASILEVIAADKLNYFKDLCLDVEMQPGPGDTSQNAKLLASGKVAISPLSEQDVITSNLNGLAVTGISSYSNAGLDVLMTNPSITDLAQLKGKPVGQKGWLPLSVSAMLAKAGVEGDAIKQVKVGYDPSILPRGQVDALTAFVSNEPNQLKKAGEKVTVWQPKDFDIPASLGSFAVNPDFAAKHPTAVEDFLRASYKAYAYCADDAHVKECLGYQKKVAGAESDTEHETEVWKTETAVVADNPLPGKFGSVDLDNVRSLAGVVATFMGADVTADKAVAWFDNSFTDAVVGTDGAVIWPAS